MGQISTMTDTEQWVSNNLADWYQRTGQWHCRECMLEMGAR